MVNATEYNNTIMGTPGYIKYLFFKNTDDKKSDYNKGEVRIYQYLSGYYANIYEYYFPEPNYISFGIQCEHCPGAIIRHSFKYEFINSKKHKIIHLDNNVYQTFNNSSKILSLAFPFSYKSTE